MTKEFYLGIDIGSTTLKAVLLTPGGHVHHSLYQRTRAVPDAAHGCSGHCRTCGACNLGAIAKTIKTFLREAGTKREALLGTVVTGSQIVEDLHNFVHYDAFVSEVSAHVAGACLHVPGCKAILDVGGQDSKAMLYNENMRMWMSKISGICAAGTGAFLDSVAAKLNVSVEEISDRVNYESDLQISSVCAVLGATSVNKFKNRYPLGDVLAAACRAQARTVMSGVGELLLNYRGDIVFQGGVAANRAVAHFLEHITGNKIIIPRFHHVMGAVGAACLARQLASLNGRLHRHGAANIRGLTGTAIPDLRDGIPALNMAGSWQERIALQDGLSARRARGGQIVWEMSGIPLETKAGNNGGPPKISAPAADVPRTRSRLNDAIAMRTDLTRGEFFSRRGGPLVWRNLFFPPEILNALGVRTLTLETYAALRGHSQKRLRQAFDRAATKGFSSETCSFLRVLEGDDRLPEPAFVVTTSEPCQQGERVIRDLANSFGASDRVFALHTPSQLDDYTVEHVAGSLQEAVVRMERAMGLKLDMARLKEACALSNEAREFNLRCNLLRYTSPPLIRSSEAILFATGFSQLWGRKEFVELMSVFYEGLMERKEEIERTTKIDDTHRLLWLHLPPFYSTRLMDYIEVTCNAPIIFEEVNFVAWDALDPEDPYRSLARKLLTAGFLDPVVRADYIRDYAYLGRLSGCILYNHGFGRCSMSDSTFIKYLRETLQQLTIPLLVLDGDCLDETTDPCSTLTKVAAFTEALNLTKHGNIFGPEGKQPGHCSGREDSKEMVRPALVCAAGDESR